MGRDVLGRRDHLGKTDAVRHHTPTLAAHKGRGIIIEMTSKEILIYYPNGT